MRPYVQAKVSWLILLVLETVLSMCIIFSYICVFSMSRCHGPKPPPNPEFTLKPRKKKHAPQSECTPGSPCPPCPELVWRPCVGQHVGAEKMVGLC